MKNYNSSLFTNDEFIACRIAQKVVSEIGEDPDAEWTRCHEVARIVERVVAIVLGKKTLWVADGVYGLVDHSWLWTSDPALGRFGGLHRMSCPNILDPYSVGRLPDVNLVSCKSTALPHYGMLYQVRDPRTDIHEKFVEGESVRIIPIVGALFVR